MNEDTRETLISTVLVVLGLGVIVIFSIMLLVWVGEELLPSSPTRGASYQEVQSLKMCAAAHGTPVLEENGNAYKSCAINGKSSTRNVVK